MKEKHCTIIKTYDALVRYVRHTKKGNIVSIENIEYSRELDLRKLLVDTELYKGIKGNSILTLTRPLRLANVKCKAISVTSICCDDATNYFQINNSTIESLRIHSCKFSSFEIKKSVITKLTIIGSHIRRNVFFDFSGIPDNSPVNINFEGTLFSEDVTVSNLKMINKTSEFLMRGEKMRIGGDFILSKSILLCGKFEFSCEFKHNFVLRMINSVVDENENQLLPNMGDISINGGKILEDLVLEDCHLNRLNILNNPVGGTREFEFSYNQLKGDAAMILRDGASKKHNILLEKKYTGEVFDNQLKNLAKTTCREWVSLFESNKRKSGIVRKVLYSFIFEPIVLLIPSLASSEGLLLWLSKYSNDYNRSWIRGIFFTLVITLFSYYLLNYAGMEQPYFVFDIYFNGYGEVAKGYLRLLDVFDLTGIANNVRFELNIWGYIILFVAKVLIFYGCWQTIYAFFRYRK